MGDSINEVADRFSKDIDLSPQPGRHSQSNQSLLMNGIGKRRSSKPASKRCIYIGIDFGTTYSGVAWAQSADPDNVQIVTNWSTRGRNLSHIRDDAKAPTALYYQGNNIYWGHGITEDEDAIRWFKLLLLKEEDLQDDVRQSPYLKKARAKLAELGISPEQAVADYLSLLWDHTVASMKRARGAGAIDGLPFKVVLTVPAIWKPYAHQKMHNAARTAGILNSRLCGETTLKLVSEPEAAALATLCEFQNAHNIEKGDVYVVCDVGGGTADLISYKIQGTGPLRLDESVEGKGKLCGGIFVDENFQALIKSRIGEQRWEKLSRSSKVKLMNDEWEFGIKRAFDGDASKDWTCQLPPDAVGRFGPHRLNDRKAEVPMVSGQIQFSTDHIRKVFSRVIGDIRGLINNQIKNIQQKEGKMPKAVILVGGFGSCDYLYKILAKEHERTGVDILQPSGKGPWTAICRGAVFCAASSAVQSRISRFSYGLRTAALFDEEKHLESDKFWCSYYGVYYASNQMIWYVRKGDNVDALKPVRLPFIQPLGEAPATSTYGQTIFQSEETPAPTRFNDTVTELCEIKCTFDVRFEDLPERRDVNNKPFREYEHEIEVVHEDATLKFFVSHKGSRKGSQAITVELDPNGKEAST